MAVEWLLYLASAPTHTINKLPNPDTGGNAGAQTGMIPRVRSVGYLYLFELSVFLRMFWRVFGTRARAEGSRVGRTMERGRRRMAAFVYAAGTPRTDVEGENGGTVRYRIDEEEWGREWAGWDLGDGPKS